MTDYDSPWKEALDVYFRAFLAFFYPLIHDDIDWSAASNRSTRSCSRSHPSQARPPLCR